MLFKKNISKNIYYGKGSGRATFCGFSFDELYYSLPRSFDSNPRGKHSPHLIKNFTTCFRKCPVEKFKVQVLTTFVFSDWLICIKRTYGL